MARQLLGAVLVLVLLAPTAGAPESPPLAIVVHRARHADLSLSELAQVYFRRKRFWDDGTPIVPLNLPAGTPLRVAFSHAVLRRSEDDLADYWNRQYFYGVLPPATLASTAAVLRYVAADPNAIGYVPLSEVDDSVTVVLHVE
jgi:hypothetical protein